MSNPQPQVERKSSTFLNMLPGLIVSLLAIFILSRFVDLQELKQAFAIADFRWLPLVLLPFFGTLLARSKAWRTLLEEEAQLKDTFYALNQGYLLNNILPFRLGELGRALILGERSGLGFWRVLSTIVVERIFDVGFAALMIVVSLRFILDVAWAQSASRIALILVFLGFSTLFVLARNPGLIKSLLKRLTGRWPKLRDWLLNKMNAFLEGLGSLRSSKRFSQVAFWLALAWFFNMLWYLALQRAFFPEINWLWAAMTIGAGSLGVAIPSSPGYVGVLEGTVVAAFSLFGVDPAISLAYAIVAHTLYFIVTGVLGAIGFSQQGRSLGAIYQRLLNRKSGNLGA